MATLPRSLLQPLQRFWTASLKRQLILGVAAVHALLMSIFIFELMQREQDFLLQQSLDQASSLAQTLATNSLVWTLSQDLAGLEELTHSVERYPDLRYAMILDVDGQVLAHTEAGIAGQYVLDPISRQLLTAPHELQLLHKNGTLIDVAAPMLAGKELIGWARIGLGQDRLAANMERVLLSGLLFTLVAILAGIGFAYLMARSLTRDIYALVETAESVRQGQNQQRARLDRPDELGQLAADFNLMLDTLDERERRLKAKTEELTRSNAELERFAYVASHDLQEPLRMVGSYVQLLARRYQGKLDADADDFIHYAVDGATRMQQLINDLLAYSRVGTRGGQIVPTDTNRILAAALFNLGHSIQASGAQITHDPLPSVLADPSQLTQVLQNLIGNALKFHGAAAPLIHVSAREEADVWRFAVRDNGIGIDPSQAERIFQIFQRLHTREEYPGTGIGLSICKRIVERHGGRIGVLSEPGGGAEFWFTLPKNIQRENPDV